MKVDPENSSGLSLRSRAREARSFTLRAMSTTDFRSALRTTGVISPSGIATATPTCTSPWAEIRSPIHDALTMGNRVRAFAHAFTTRSLNETFTSSPRRSCSRSSTAGPMSISIVT